MTEQTLEVSVIPIFMSSQIRSILQLGSMSVALLSGTEILIMTRIDLTLDERDGDL